MTQRAGWRDSCRWTHGGASTGPAQLFPVSPAGTDLFGVGGRGEERFPLSWLPKGDAGPKVKWSQVLKPHLDPSPLCGSPVVPSLRPLSGVFQPQTRLWLLESPLPWLLARQLPPHVMSCSHLCGWPSAGLVGVWDNVLSGSATAHKEPEEGGKKALH